MRMNKFCTLLLLLPLALTCRAHTLPGAATPQQVDEILDHLSESLNDYVFPETAAELKRQLQAKRSEYRVITDPKALATRLTDDLRAVGHDKHLEVSYGDDMGFAKDPTPEELRRAHTLDAGRGFGVRSARRLPGNIGYIDLAYFSGDPEAGAAIAAAMQIIHGTDALILDLRRNGGGGPASTVLLSYFFAEPTQLSSVVERKDGLDRERQKWTMPYVPGGPYPGKAVFVLTSHHTWSAAELCAYDLKTRKRATLVGEVTGGAANSSSGLISLGYGFAALIPNGQTRSPITHTSWEGTGVEPDVATNASEALIVAYKLALKDATNSGELEELTKERQLALQDPQAALAEEITGFPKKQ
jgi:Peptidase family S41/N-terminal domain of Peptidase_S41 in eukaryotic IRBP